MRRILSFVLVVTLGGCAAAPTVQNSVAVPMDRLLLNSQKSEKNTAEIVLVRDRSFAGGGCYYAVYVG